MYLSDLDSTVVKGMRNINSDLHIRFSLPFQIQNFLNKHSCNSLYSILSVIFSNEQEKHLIKQR